jgi:hypothetical protein
MNSNEGKLEQLTCGQWNSEQKFENRKLFASCVTSSWTRHKFGLTFSNFPVEYEDTNFTSNSHSRSLPSSEWEMCHIDFISDTLSHQHWFPHSVFLIIFRDFLTCDKKSERTTEMDFTWSGTNSDGVHTNGFNMSYLRPSLSTLATQTFLLFNSHSPLRNVRFMAQAVIPY